MTEPFARVDGRNGGPRLYKLAPPLVDTKMELPSVTSVLGALPKPALKMWGEKLVAEAAIDHLDKIVAMDPADAVAWLRKAPNRVLNAAGARGTDIHLIAELVLRSMAPDRPTMDIEPGMATHVREWAEEWIGDIITIEQPMVNVAHGWGGSADLIYRDRQGAIVLGDWKSSRSVYPDNALQLAAYANASHWIMNADTDTPSLVEPIHIDKLAILHITDKDGVTYYEPAMTIDALYRTFRCVQGVWNGLVGPNKIRLSITPKPPRPTVEEYIVHLRARCLHAQSEQVGFRALLAARWPRTLPTIKSGLIGTLYQCETADDVIVTVERDLGVTFGAVPVLGHIRGLAS